MQVHGLSRPEAATYGSTILIGWAIGSPLIGWLSARLGRRKPVLVAGIVLCFALWLMIVFVMPALPRPSHYAFLFAAGLFSGIVSVCFSLAAEHGPPRAPGVSSALVNTLVMAGAALAQGVVGFVLDAHWQGTIERGVHLYGEDAFHAAFLLLPAFSAAGVIAALCVAETHGRLRGEREPSAPTMVAAK
jgi:MFS family permease